MSATELDLPLLATPDQIRRREFVTSRRGYDPQQVRDFLTRVADQVDQMSSLLREAKMQAEAAARAESEPRPDPYEQLAARMADMLRTADERASAIAAEAERDARRMLDEATAEADRIRTDAQARAEAIRAEAEEALREANERAEQAVSGLSSRRDALIDELGRMRERLAELSEGLGAIIEHPQDASRPIVTVDHPSTGKGPTAEPVSEESSIEPRYEDLWEGEELQLDLPEIPPLDLTWDDLED